ncbi:hypothetical protein KR044_005083, partial [Drosophila immigrans]
TQSRLSPRLNGQSVVNKTIQRYLGIHLDKKLRMHHHITQLCIRLKATYYKLEWLLGTNSKLSTNCKVTIYKQMIAPIWKYALPIWGAVASTTQVRRIEVCQNLIIRRIVKASWYTRNEVIRDIYNIKTIEETFKSTSDRFFKSLMDHPNVNARNLFTHPFVPSRLVRPRYLSQLQLHVLPLRNNQQQQRPLQ